MPLSIIRDKNAWDGWVAQVRHPSVYATHNWVKAAEVLEEAGHAEMAVYEARGRLLIHPYIKRRIGDTGHYDLISAYDFGGFWSNVIDLASYEYQLAGFLNLFLAYCQQQRIVSEFTRFHPAQRKFPDLMGAELVRENVIIPLGDEDHMWNTLVPKLRTDLKKAQSNGLEFRPCGFREFLDLYHANVKQKGRSDYYLFPLEWLQKAPSVQCHGVYDQEDHLCAAHVYVADMPQKTLFYFLSASDPEYLHLKPNDFGIWEMMRMGSIAGFDTLHLGGGQPESLMHFKAKFSPQRVPYYVAKKIFMPEVYDKLVDGMPGQSFPAYR